MYVAAIKAQSLIIYLELNWGVYRNIQWPMEKQLISCFWHEYSPFMTIIWWEMNSNSILTYLVSLEESWYAIWIQKSVWHACSVPEKSNETWSHTFAPTREYYKFLIVMSSKYPFKLKSSPTLLWVMWAIFYFF